MNIHNKDPPKSRNAGFVYRFRFSDGEIVDGIENLYSNRLAIWSDENIETDYWDNLVFQRVYEPCRDVAISRFPEICALGLSEDGKIDYHSNRGKLVIQTFGHLFKILERDDIPIELRREIFHQALPESMPFSIRDIQRYVYNVAEKVTENICNIPNRYPQFNSKQRKMIESAYLKGAIDSTITSIPVVIINIVEYRCLERLISGKNGVDSPTSYLARLIPEL